MRDSILVLGSVNRDLVVHAPRLPLPGETLRGQRFGSCLGGKGANQAVAAARLGARVALAAQVGRREGGIDLVAQLQAEGVNLRQLVQPEDQAPGVALIVVGAADGENQIVTVAGSNATLPATFGEALDLSGVGYLVAQQELPVAVLESALRRARAQGVRTILNAAPFREDAAHLLAWVDVLVVNETEAASLANDRLADEEPVAGARDRGAALAQALRRRGPAAVLVSQGAQGLAWADAERSLTLPAFPVTAVDTVGAGDTLVGALVTALAEGQGVDAALRFALAAASLAVSRPGVQAAMPRREEVDAVLQA